MSETVVPGSFRDPAGFVWTEDGAVFRQVNESFGLHYDRLLESGLYAALVADGLLIPHQEVPATRAIRPGAYKVLRPEVVDFVSYPYEWCFSQLQDAALLTMRIQERAIEFGMSLRDASAFNVQFHRGRPVLIDTLSFEVLDEGRPWIAYRQYCQHFLAPLALMAHRDVRLGSLLRTHIDGVPLDLASKLLPRKTRRRPALQLHIHAHARSQRKYEARDISAAVARRGFSLRALSGLVASLRRATAKLKAPEPDSAWSRYHEEGGHYGEEGLARKKEIVGSFLDTVEGDDVWDLGANVGTMARDATARGKRVVCFDVDPACVEVNYRRIRENGETGILPLVCDLTNPTPGTGWGNRERASLVERGPADVTMALALVHHLAIGHNVALPLVAAFFAELGRWLIVEFVPKDDPMTRRLLSNREDIFPEYTVGGFEAAFSEHFAVERKEPIAGTDRVVYLMAQRGGRA